MPDLSDEPDVHLLCGDAHDQLCSLPTDSVDCAVTSPPYFGLRDYGHTGQYGLERTPQEYADVLVRVSAEVARVLHPSGTFWLNVADCYGGGGIARPTGEWPDRHNLEDRANGMRRSFDQEKCLLGIPAVIERALVADGWVVRNRIIWANADRCHQTAKIGWTRSTRSSFCSCDESGAAPTTTSTNGPPGRQATCGPSAPTLAPSTGRPSQ